MKSKNLSENIIKNLKSKGFKNIVLDSVIETKYILRRSGENFRKFLFSFQDLKGNELCLRPDLSISSVLRYLENKSKKREKIFYNAEAFRKTYQKKDSIIKNQIGFEILGSNNKKKDDCEIINTSLKVLKLSGYNKATLKLGNVELFYLLVDKLEMPQRWKQRLKRYYWNENYFSQLLKRLETNSDIDPVFVETDKSKFKKMQKMDKNKIIAGRTFQEILSRFSMKINDPRKSSKGKINTKIIKEFLKIKCPLDKAPKILNSFFKKYSLNIIVGKDYFPIQKKNNKKLKVEFLASNGRELEIYSSLVFSIDVKIKSKTTNFILGGRYDLLTENLGFKKVPAVGAAINMGAYE